MRTSFIFLSSGCSTTLMSILPTFHQTVNKFISWHGALLKRWCERTMVAVKMSSVIKNIFPLNCMYYWWLKYFINTLFVELKMLGDITENYCHVWYYMTSNFSWFVFRGHSATAQWWRELWLDPVLCVYILRQDDAKVKSQTPHWRPPFAQSSCWLPILFQSVSQQ